MQLLHLLQDEECTPIKQDVKKGNLRFYPYNINWNYGLLPQVGEALPFSCCRPLLDACTDGILRSSSTSSHGIIFMQCMQTWEDPGHKDTQLDAAVSLSRWRSDALGKRKLTCMPCKSSLRPAEQML